MATEEKEMVLDMSAREFPTYLSKDRKKKVRRSYPSEKIYNRRKDWWTSKGFGEDAAKWAAGWRLGEPRKTRNLKPGEETSIDNAIRIGDRRSSMVDYRVRTFNETRDKAIKHLDDELRRKDLEEKISKGILDIGTSIYHKSVKPNIYKDISG